MTRDEVIDMAKEAGFTSGEIAWHDNMFEAFAKLVAEREREACAKVCEQYKGYGGNLFAPAIRTRGTHENN